MRKSNWIIIAIVVIASIFFLWLWYYLGFNYVDDPLDLVITIIWWLIVILLCLAIRKFEKDRQRSIRTIYVGNELLYNSELGVVRLDQGAPYVPAMQQILETLEYNFDRQEADENNGQKARFRYVVHTDKYDDEGDTWEGEIVRVSDPDNPLEFESMEELSTFIDKK